MAFQRSVGFIGIMFAAVSGILGSGWLFGPLYAAQFAGPASLVAWFLGAAGTLVIALTFAELVCLFPKAGGSAKFMFFSHGVLASFIFNWLMWIGYAAVAPVETMGVMQYLSSAFPQLMEDTAAVHLSGLGYAVAIGVLLAMCLGNLMSIRWVMKLNSALVWIKIAVPLVIAGALLTAFHPENLHQFGGFMPFGTKGIASALSLGGIMFSFAGFAPAIALAGETRNPQRLVPLALILALGLSFVLYFVLQLAFIGALPSNLLAHGFDHLSFAHEAGPFVGLSEILGFHFLKELIFLVAILAPLGTAFIFITTTARVSYAMSENGYFPSFLQQLSQKGVPYWAVLLNFVLSASLFFPAPGWEGMVGILVSAFVLCYAIGPLSLVALRRRMSNVHRPFRLPWAYLWSFLAFYISNLVVYWVGWPVFRSIAWAFWAGLIWLAGISYSKRSEFNKLGLEFKQGWWVIVYLSGMMAISYFGNFGGRQLLSFGSDFVLIGLLSALILYCAYLTALPLDKIKSRLVS